MFFCEFSGICKICGTSVNCCLYFIWEDLSKQSFKWKRFSLWVKDTHRERAQLNKTPALKKVGIWTFGSWVHQINSLQEVCLNIGFWYDSFVWKWCILVLSTKNRYSSFLKKFFVFQKICFTVKVLKSFKTSTDCHMKTCRSLKRRAILKIPSTIF